MFRIDLHHLAMFGMQELLRKLRLRVARSKPTKADEDQLDTYHGVLWQLIRLTERGKDVPTFDEDVRVLDARLRAADKATLRGRKWPGLMNWAKGRHDR